MTESNSLAVLSEDEILAHVGRAETGRIGSWSGPPEMLSYGSQSVRRREAIEGFTRRYVREHGALPTGAHVARVTFGAAPDCDVPKPTGGTLVIAMTFNPPGVNEPAVTPRSILQPVPVAEAVADDYEVVMSSQFSSMTSSWTEYLCLSVSPTSVTVTRRGHMVLGDARDYAVELDDGTYEYRLPDEIDGWSVVGIESEAVVGGPLVLHDDDSELIVTDSDLEPALDWLKSHEWDRADGFEAAWQRIQAAARQIAESASPL